MATTVVTAKPMTTGLKFFLAKSKGLTPQMAAAGITAHDYRDDQDGGQQLGFLHETGIRFFSPTVAGIMTPV